MAFWEAGFEHGLSAGQVEEMIFVKAAGSKEQYHQILGKHCNSFIFFLKWQKI